MRAVFLVIALVASLPAFGQGVRREAWLEDFAQLRQEMAAHYANLEWAVAERGLDLKQLSAETEARIRNAKSEAEAKGAIELFLQSFGDGHLVIDGPSSGPVAAAPTPRRGVCERLDFRPRAIPPGVEFATLPGYRSLSTGESKYLPAGSGTLRDGKRFGVVRIGRFMELAFPGLCDAALAELALTPDAPCDAACELRVQLRASDLLTAALAAQVARLKKEEIDVLLVDITGNMGGNNVYEPMARLLTPKRLRSPRTGFVRHPHWVKVHQDRLAELEAGMAKASPAMRRRLAQAAEAVRRDLAEAKKRCDLSPLWDNRKVGCSNVVALDERELSYAKPGELSNTPLGSVLFSASMYRYTEGLYSGPLVVLIDERTGSSSEAFASMLRDNGAATLIGHPSLGAGCGYTAGGIPTVLKNSGLRVKVPDCVRFRADGSSEINGITPDVIVPWRANDSAFQRARRVAVVLERLLEGGRQ